MENYSDTSGEVDHGNQFMDEIIFFGGEDDVSTEELPWGKDWAKRTTTPSEPKEVFNCYIGDKGILLETGEYKTFIFKREKVHAYLKEALHTWVDKGMIVKPLIASYVNKKFCYGLNNSKPDVVWVQNENKFTSIRPDDRTENTWIPSGNPFLPPNNPTETATKEEPKSAKRAAK